MKNNENVNIQAQSIRGQNSSHVRIRIENKSDAEICVAMWFAGWKPQQKFHMSAKSVEGLMPTHVAVGAELGFVVDLGGEPIQELDQLGITDGRNRFWHVCSEELAEIIEHSTADAKLWPPPDKSLLEGRLRECSVAIKALLIERIDEDKQLEIRFTNQSNMPIHLTGAILEWKYANPVEHKESGPGKPRVALAGGSINLTPNFRIESPVQPNQSVAFIPDRRLVSAIAQVNEEVGDNGINVTVFTDTKLAWVETGNGIAAVVRSFADHISKHLPVPSNAGSPLGNNLPFVLWSIPCFDREREKPLPVFNRSYVLEWSELDHAQLREVIEILGSRKSDDLIPSNLDSVVFKMSRTPSMPDDRMLKYRKYFKEIDGSSLQSMFDASRASQLIFVDLNRDYFEDENGNEVTHYEMIAQVTGNERPIARS